MIRIFCQYNYGGYSIFPIVEKSESMLLPLDATQPNDVPKEVVTLFNRSGIKVLYEWIPGDRLLFAYKYIPANGLDSTGRHFECGVQFVGDHEDKADLDRIVCTVLKDTGSFERFFADLFHESDGLFCKADELNRFMDHAKASSEEFMGGVYGIIKKRDPHGGVIILSPKHNSFMNDRDVRRKVLDENRIAHDSIKYAYIVGIESFASELISPLRQSEIVRNTDVQHRGFSLKRILKIVCIPITAISGLCLISKKTKKNR